MFGEPDGPGDSGHSGVTIALAHVFSQFENLYDH